MRVLERCLALYLVLVAPACSRNAIEAVNLANEGDKSKDVNPEEAISKYEQALKLDPDAHRIAYKLVIAYRKKEDWQKVVESAVKAEQASERATKKKTFANYYFEHGYALARLAEKSGPSGGSWADAKQPLQTAIQIDPNHAQAHMELGEVLLRLDDEQGALESYTKAIEKKPDELQFYPALSDLYTRLGYYDQAEQVLKEGLSFAKEGDKHLYMVHGMMGQVHEFKNNNAGAIASYEAAKKSCGQCADRKEAYFNLGAAYYASNPPRSNEAIQNLQTFWKVGCKGGSNKKFEEQCAQTQQMVSKLGGTLQ